MTDTTQRVERRCRLCGAVLGPVSSFCSRCGATAALASESDPVREKLERLFHGEYELDRELGRGGMAVVYQAFDPALQRRVAIKALLPEIAADPEMAERFLREARTVAALQHPHVVTVYAVRSGESTQAIVMQYVDGRSLDVVLREDGVQSLDVAGLMLAQVADGLQHAHERGVIHRDVKPANVLLDADGHAVVSDFGIARRDGAPRITETGMVVGTWAYMSPEQRTGDALTAATDQYALGVLAFEALTGRLPFTGTARELLRAHLNDPAPSMRGLRPEVPEDIDQMVQRMLGKTAEERFPSLREVERAFRRLSPNEKATTALMAALAHPRASLLARSAPTEPMAPAAIAAPQAPTVTTPSRARLTMLIAGIVVIAAAVAWQWRAPADSPVSAAEGGAASASTASRDGVADGPGKLGAPIANTRRDTGGLRAGNAVPVDQSPSRAVVTATPDGRAAGSTTLPNSTRNSEQPQPPNAAPALTPPAAAPAPVARASEPIAPAARSLPTVTDARRLAREFVTQLNQHRWSELNAMPSSGGDAALRAEVIRLSRTATDFSAGFDRLPSAAVAAGERTEIEFVVDLEWRGGRRLVLVRLSAVPSADGWRSAEFAVEAVP
ncbi:MAG: serine/threonine-protein kinase [Gemmatimonadetes bacterium]|nr:serine/threonine-protein kinase [Gemmatimonadota bacterium]